MSSIDNDVDRLPNKPTIRTITVFLTLEPKTFHVSWGSLFSTQDLEAKISQCATLLQEMKEELQSNGYVVQTLRIATNPFGEWLTNDDGETASSTRKDASSTSKERQYDQQQQFQSPPKKHKMDKMSRLERLDQLLANYSIDFCSVGPAQTHEETRLCVDIVSQSHRFSCSSIVESGDVDSAQWAADTVLTISKLGDKVNAPSHAQNGLGNFRFCTASSCRPGIPFFPASKAESINQHGPNDSDSDVPLKFAIGLENGPILHTLLRECQSIAHITTRFQTSYTAMLQPIQEIAQSVAKSQSSTFLGIDTSLNPSLDGMSGSIAASMEQLDEISIFGGHGTIAAAAALTKAIQTLPENIQLTGYCGLMLPVCEDIRLAELANAISTDDDKVDSSSSRRRRLLQISDLLSISSVCGVGVDTVPIPGNVSRDRLASLMLDVAGIAGRWNKSLSCRVFPVPGRQAGEETAFDSPYMVNSTIFSLE